MKISLKIFFSMIFSLGLLLFWIVTPIIFSGEPITILTDNYSKSTIQNYSTREIHKGHIIRGTIKASENNLGILLVRFATHNRINNDILKYRLKEQGEDKWYYQGEYRVDQFQPEKLFTFGFPQINDSKGKQYIFELESTNGKEGDAVSLSSVEPVLAAKYKFSKTELTNITTLAYFAFRKIVDSYSSVSFFMSSLPFLLPLILYVYLYFIRKIVPKKRIIWFQNIFTVILVTDLFFMPGIVSIAVILQMLFWITIIFLNRLESSVSFFYALIILVFSILPFVLNLQTILQNFAIWVYFFLAVGTIQLLFEVRNKPKKLTTYNDVLNDFGYKLKFLKLKSPSRLND